MAVTYNYVTNANGELVITATNGNVSITQTLPIKKPCLLMVNKANKCFYTVQLPDDFDKTEFLEAIV